MKRSLSYGECSAAAAALQDGNSPKRQRLQLDGDDDQLQNHDDSDDDDDEQHHDHDDSEDDQQPSHNNGIERNGADSKLATGKPCLLKVNIFIKLVNNQLIVEVHLLSGTMGREGANQILTFIRNKILKR